MSMNKTTAMSIAAVVAGLSLALDLLDVLGRNRFTLLAVTRMTGFAAFLAFYATYRWRNKI
jgi:hypothetical protein